MKFFAKVLICVTLLAMAGPFFLKGPDGRPLIDARKFGVSAMSDFFSMFKNLMPGNSTHQIITDSDTEQGEDNPHADLLTMKGDVLYYRWQDENGTWQFTKTRPPEHVTDYIPIVTNVNANLMDSMRQDKIEETLGITKEDVIKHADRVSKDKADDVDLSEELAELGFEDANPLKSIPKILENTRQIQENAKQKQQILDSL